MYSIRVLFWVLSINLQIKQTNVSASEHVIQRKANIYTLFMTSRRNQAAGISHDQSFLIFGGFTPLERLSLLSSTEIITEQGGVSPGPEMPEANNYHRFARVNATTSILTGGGNGHSRKTWFFNHISQQFQPGPLLITGRFGHASATMQDHVTKENIVAVAGGVKVPGPGSPFDSTELLINGESEWQHGKKLSNLNNMGWFAFSQVQN